MQENIEAFLICTTLYLFAVNSIDTGTALACVILTYLASKIEL